MTKSDSFVNRLNEAMLAKKIRAIDLAELTGLSKSRISQYVNGQFEAKSHAVCLIAEAMGVNEKWLLGYDVSMCSDEVFIHEEIEPDGNVSGVSTDITTLGVFERDNRILVSSRDVAKCFEKEHKNVVRDIRDIDVSSEFWRLNFEQSDYKDERGKLQPEYLMTRDGFTILAMGYTGKKAMCFKEAYIQAFNEMERKLSEVISCSVTESRDTIGLTQSERIKVGEVISKCPQYNMIALLDLYKPYLSDEALHAYKFNIERINATEPTNIDNEQLRKALIDFKEKQKLSQRDLAKLLGVSQTTVCDWFCNKSKPRKPEVVFKICELLQIERTCN